MRTITRSLLPVATVCVATTCFAQATVPEQVASNGADSKVAGRAGDERRSSRQTGTLEEIVVTAAKRKENVLDVPMSIAVIGNEDIERRGLVGMEDYLRSIPGVAQVDNGPLNNAIIIRGINTSPEFGSATVASYFDETPITGVAGYAGTIDVRPVDIERIEVLRGPQGTAYGSSSLSGAMRIIPARPKLDDFGGKFSLSYSETGGPGSDNSMLQGVLNIPVVKEKLALRAVAYRYDDSGFYRNIAGTDPETLAHAESFGLEDYVRGYTQDDVGRIVSTGGRLAALWQATDKLELSMNVLTQKIEQDGYPLTTTGLHDQTKIPVVPEVRLRGEPGEVSDTDIDLINLVLNYNLGWGTLTSAASWIESGADTVTVTGARAGLPLSSPLRSNVRMFVTETRLASQLTGPFQFLGGVYYEDTDGRSSQSYEWPGATEINPAGTDPMFYSDGSSNTKQHAIFGEFTYNFTEKLFATVGARYFQYDLDNHSLTEGGFVGVPIGAGERVPQVGDDSDSSFKGYLGYKPTPDSLLYASWSEGFRLGPPDGPGLSSGECDIDSDGLVDGTNVSIASTKHVDPDFLEDYEIGAKFMLFDRRLVLDAAVYHIDWDGLPVFTVANCANGPRSYTANGGAATSEGVELQASVSVFDGLRLDMGAGYTDAKLSTDVPAQGWVDGQRLPGSPKINANIAAQYDFSIGAYRAFVRADSFYVGEFYGDLQETPGLRAGDYIKVDMRAGLAIRDLSVEIFVRNLTDEDAFTWQSPFRSTLGSYRLRPRTLGMQVGYSFE